MTSAEAVVILKRVESRLTQRLEGVTDPPWNYVSASGKGIFFTPDYQGEANIPDRDAHFFVLARVAVPALLRCVSDVLELWDTRETEYVDIKDLNIPYNDALSAVLVNTATELEVLLPKEVEA